MGSVSSLGSRFSGGASFSDLFGRANVRLRNFHFRLGARNLALVAFFNSLVHTLLYTLAGSREVSGLAQFQPTFGR